MKKLTDAERKVLSEIDAEIQTALKQRRAKELSDSDYMREMERLYGEKAVILMTRKDVRRRSIGLDEP